ncbi:MAG: hypothetical protein KBD02_03805 [Bacteroides sp.]|nr:hypothetical protein [Bacteroides sp.]
MALGKNLGDFTKQFNSTYNITLDMSGWDKTTVQTSGAVLGTINIQGSNDGGANASNQGDAELAINFTPIQAKNLATGSMVNAIYGAGLFEIDINAQYLRLQGAPAGTPTNVYRILLFNSKIS